MKNPAFLAILFLFAALNVSGVQLANAQGSVDTDREALVALYDLTDGDNWESNSFWKSDQPIGQWYGVDTDRDGRATRILLPRNNLSGPIPTEIGNLTNLREIDFLSNNLSDIIPAEIGNLTNLEKLDLGNSDLSGSIPKEIGNLTNLLQINLRFNDLSGRIPTEIGNLTNLENLNLGANDLSGRIPPEIGNLSNLIELRLDFNDLSGPIPPEIGNLSNLETLSLHSNNLSGSIPTEIGNLTNLETLFIELNNLSGSVPLSFANLLLLRFFYAYDLDNDVCIPASLEDWYMGIPFNEINDIHDLTTPLPVCAGPPTSSETEEIPATFSLEQNYPNPFNPSTAIEYSLDAPGHVELAIYNMTGAKVATLVYGYMPAGSHSVAWKSDVPSGTYLYRLTASGHSETRYMTLVR